ncbi:hypothetical protein SAMN05421823_106136 [Catalinimonas alkaloidigena]|uniref:Uncharacterized protein n=1 Tax=Catalinimonas alkaloidigena TaxID=1075417 RepID=A0A1G9KFC5_9BACT|nr:hypothetical protein [Catalinimonas alkaloidigena]SDL48075.1 hypothetical protein SAMN05421823_106136 [Catalinimonas alkaloidigena]
MKCSGERYYANALGSTEKCTCQGDVHVNFGHISLLLNRPQLHHFVEYLQGVLKLEADVPDPDARCVYLPTRDEALLFAMTYHEVEQLTELLSQTLFLMEIEDLMQK